MREERFVEEHAKEPNGTQAAINAGYSARSAHVQATRLLKKDKIRQAIDRLRALSERAVQITMENIIERLRNIADDRSVPAATRVSALREINAMLGYHSARKVEVAERGVHLHIHTACRPKDDDQALDGEGAEVDKPEAG